MSIPITGLLVLLFAVFCFFFRPRWLYPALILSIPFSALAVVNFGWSAETVGATEKSLMAWQLFAVLWVLRETLLGVPFWHRPGWFLTRRTRLALLAFLAAIVASWSVPMILNGTSWVTSWKTAPLGGGSSSEAVALRFTSYNLTQSAYIVFGVLLIIFIAAENCRSARLLYTLRLYLKSCMFAAAWGLFQLWCVATGTAYPSQVFNTSRSLTGVLGDKQHLLAGGLFLSRVSSVALEPSMFAEELLFAFVIVLTCLGFGRRILSRRWDLVAAALLGAGLAVSTSTTAYMGMLAALIFAGVALARAKSPHWARYPAAALSVVLVAILLTQIPLIHDLAEAAFVTKFQAGIGGTGSERLRADLLAADVFMQHPILGAGWHEVDCYDVFFLLLANVGIVGLAAFAGFLFPVLQKLWGLTKLRYFPAMLLLPGVGLSLFLAEGGGFALIPVNWLALGLAAAAAAARLNIPTAFAVDRDGEITGRTRFPGADGPAIAPSGV
jgi:hypothetical protein